MQFIRTSLFHNNDSFFWSLRLFKRGLDFIHKKNSVFLIQYGAIGKGKVWYLALEAKNPKPRPIFLMSWEWNPRIRLLKGRLTVGTTTKPVRGANGQRIRVRRRNTQGQLG